MGAVKNFLSRFSSEKNFQRLNVFFHRIHRIERKSYTFTQIHRESYIFLRLLVVTSRAGWDLL